MPTPVFGIDDYEYIVDEPEEKLDWDDPLKWDLQHVVDAHLEDKEIPRRVITLEQANGACKLEKNVKLRLNYPRTCTIIETKGVNQVTSWSGVACNILDAIDTDIRIEETLSANLPRLLDCKVEIGRFVGIPKIKAEKCEIKINNATIIENEWNECIGQIIDTTFIAKTEILHSCKLTFINCTFLDKVEAEESKCEFDGCTFLQTVDITGSDVTLTKNTFLQRVTLSNSTIVDIANQYVQEVDVSDADWEVRKSEFLLKVSVSNSHTELAEVTPKLKWSFSNTELIMHKIEYKLEVTFSDCKAVLTECTFEKDVTVSNGNHRWHKNKFEKPVTSSDASLHLTENTYEKEVTFSGGTVIIVEDSYEKEVTMSGLVGRNKMKKVEFEKDTTIGGATTDTRLKIVGLTSKKPMTIEKFSRLEMDKNEFEDNVTVNDIIHLLMNNDSGKKDFAVTDCHDGHIADISVEQNFSVSGSECHLRIINPTVSQNMSIG